MKTIEMSETSLRSTSRTPSILQNGERSPTPSKHSTGSALSPISNKSVTSMKLQSLKQRKLELEKILIEKNNVLQRICREEALLLGYYPPSEGTNLETVDGGSNTLRKKVDTSFKLSENLLSNGKEDDVHRLLLAKQIQQQISEASLKMANDLSQTKSIRRVHKQNFEAAQQKLQAINKNLSMLKKRPNTEFTTTSTSDDINMGYHHKYSNHSNNNNNYVQNTSGYSSSNNNNSMHSNISNNKYTNSNQSHSISSSKSNNINNNNNNNNHNVSSHSLSERRNSIISTSSSQHLASKSRPRCDSYGGVGASSDYGNGSTGKQSPAPSTTMSYLHYNSHSQLADKVVYVTNAVSNAAAAANSIALVSKYGRPKTSLSVDTATGDDMLRYGDYMAQPQQKIGQQYPHAHGQYSPQDFPANSKLPPDDIDDDDDDLAGQYATLMINTQQMDYLYQPMQPAPMTPGGYEPDSHYSIIGERSSMREKRVSGDSGELVQSQGLGGYWITLDNNERIWCSLDNRYSSLDRKSQKNKIRKQIARSGNHPPTKSTSLGSFNFITRPDDASDAISITSGNSEHKRLKEKQWRETSLDGPIVKQKHPSPIPQLASPVYCRDKSKLSSQSMHLPDRNTAVNQTTITPTASIQKQPLPSPIDTSQTNLNKSLSNSATVLPTTDIVSEADYYLYQQQLSPPYYHSHPISKTPLPFQSTTSANTVRDTPLRRTVSNVSSNYPDLSNEISPMSPMTSEPNHYQNVTPTMPTTPNIGSDIHIESPKNVTVVQPAKFQPYKEVTKPFEMSDFYKYSTKFRQKNATTTLPSTSANASVATVIDQNSPKLPPKNINMIQHRAAANNTPSIPTPYTIRYH